MGNAGPGQKWGEDRSLSLSKGTQSHEATKDWYGGIASYMKRLGYLMKKGIMEEDRLSKQSSAALRLRVGALLPFNSTN
jgi:hypothetical protein